MQTELNHHSQFWTLLQRCTQHADTHAAACQITKIMQHEQRLVKRMRQTSCL